MEHFEANEIKPLFSLLPNKEFKVKKPRKDQEKLILRERLAEILGRDKKGLYFVTVKWTEKMLQDSIKACENFSNIKLRNIKFNEYVSETKK